MISDIQTIEALQSEITSLKQYIAELEQTAAAQQREIEWLYSKAFRDPLTGFWTRHYLQVAMERAIAQAAESACPISMLIIDVGQVEWANQTYGYEAGDSVLRTVGDFLHLHMHNTDIVCRHNKEFMLILPNTGVKKARQRAGELCQGVKALQVQYHRKSLGTITFSIGIAGYPEHGKTVEEILKAASFALFWAKVEGRDRIVVYEDKQGKRQLPG